MGESASDGEMSGVERSGQVVQGDVPAHVGGPAKSFANRGNKRNKRKENQRNAQSHDGTAFSEPKEMKSDRDRERK